MSGVRSAVVDGAELSGLMISGPRVVSAALGRCGVGDAAPSWSFSL